MLAGVFTSAFAGDGSSRANAIDFDLKSQTLEQGAVQLWYNVDLSSFATDEAIQLVLSNQSGEDVNVSFGVYNDLTATQSTIAENATIEVAKSKNVTIPAGLNALYSHIYLLLSADQKIALSANAVPTEPGVGCKYPVAMPFVAADKAWAPVVVEGGDSKTLRVDGLQTLKNIVPDVKDGVATVWGLKVEVENLGKDEASVHAGLSLTCGAVLQDISKTVPAGEKKSTTIKYSMVKQLAADSVFVDVVTDQDVRITISGDPQIATLVAGAEKAIHVDFDDPQTTQMARTSGEEGNVDSTNRGTYKHWFRIFVKEGESRAAKMSKDSVLKVVYTNLSSKAMEISEKYKYTADPNVVMSEDKYTLPANGSVSHSLSPAQVKQLKADSIFYFINSNQADAKFTVEWQLKPAEPGSICRTAIPYTLSSDVNEVVSFSHKTANMVWYKINYAAATDINNGAIKLTVKNDADKAGNLSADIKFDCDGAATPQTKAIAANQKMSKVISHAILESFTGSEVYVGLTADVPVTVSAQLVLEALTEDRACLEAQNITLKADANEVFHFVPKEAGKPDTAWYFIDLSAIKADPKDLNIKLTAAGSVNIDGALAFSCPATSMQKKSLSFKNEYNKTVAFSQIQSMKNPYVRVISSSAVDVELQPVAAKEVNIDLCNDPNVIEVKTENGDVHNITANYDSAWFHVNVAALRDSLKTNRVYVVYTSPKQTVAAGSSSVCNIKYALSYQNQSLENKKDNKVEITAERLDLVGDADEIWVNAKAEESYKFELLFEPIPEGEDCEHAEAFQAAKDYKQGAVAQWYSVDIAALKALGQNGTLTLKNADGKKVSVKATVYSKCGGAELGQQSISLAAGDVKVKTAGLAGYPDNVIVLLESTGDITFRLDLVNETGEECGEAILFDWDNGHTLAGGSQTWLNVKFAGNVAEGDQVIIHVQNLSKNSNKLFGGVAYNCADGLSQTGSRTLGDAELTKDVTSLIGSRDSVLVYVAPSEAVRVWVEKIAQEPLKDPITICDQATPVTYNVWYDVKGGVANQWFAVDVKDLKNNTIGDGIFRIQAANDANFKAEVAYHCPILYPMSSKTLSVKGGEEYTRDVKRSDINSVSNDSVYILVTTDKDAKFQLEIQDLAGFDCEHAIEYEWAKVVEHPAFATKWYMIPFSDIKDDPAVGLKAVFNNLAGSPFKMNVAAYSDCELTGIGEPEERTAGESKTTLKNHKDIEGYTDGTNVDKIYIRIYSEGLFSFSAIPYATVDSVIEDTVCPGTVFTVLGKDYPAVDLINGQVIAHQEFNGAYIFHSNYYNKDFMSAVDSVFTYDGILKESFDLDAFTFSCAPIILNGKVESATADYELNEAFAAWNASVDEENDFFPVQVTSFSWAKTADKTATLTIETECEPLVKNFLVEEYADVVNPAVVINQCVTPADLVVEHEVGCEGEGLKWTETTPYDNQFSGTPLDEAVFKPFLNKFPVKINGEVAGLAEANADAQNAADAYNATNPDVPVASVLGWNETGDVLSLTANCGEEEITLTIANTPDEFNDNVVTTPLAPVCDASEIPADEVTNCKDVNPYGDVLGQTCDRVTYTAEVFNTIDKAAFAPAAQVIVGLHQSAEPSVDYVAAQAELAAFLATWNADLANSAVAPEDVNFVLDPVNYTAAVTIKDACGKELVVNYTGDVHPVVTVEEHVLSCTAADDVVTVTPMPIAGSTATFDSVHVTITDLYASIATATPSFSNVNVGQLADETLTNDGANLLAEIATFLAEWNAVESNAKVEVPAQLAAVTATEAQVTLTDACGGSLPITVPVNFFPLVKDTTWTYGCNASETSNTSNIVISGAASYDSIHVDVVLPFAHVVAPEIEGVEAFCGVALELDEVKAAVAAAITAQLGEGVAAVDVNAIVWTAPEAKDILFGNDITVSYSVADECGVVVADTVSVPVQLPEYDEQTVGLSVPMLVDYKGLIVVNRLPLEHAIEEKFGVVDVEITADSIHWFKVGQTAELKEEDGAKGLYLTPQSASAFADFDASQYYITLELVISGGDNCVSTFTSVPVKGTAAAPQMFIAPNSVNPGEKITLYNLDGAQAVISVYDMMGVLVSNETITGVSSYTFEAQNNAGYYVVKVINGERVESLKYVVK